MLTQVSIDKGLNISPEVEVIERKGKGHPDTLADELGECLSIAYSKYCLNNFGVILHHNFDKVGLMGGLSKVGFNVGKIISPIRVLVNGRASLKFGDKNIPVKELITKEIQNFFTKKFPHIKGSKDLYRIIWEISTGSSPGAVSSEDSYRQHWFEPRNKDDLSELKNLNCNDTSMGVAYYGHTKLEQFVLNIEKTLNSKKYKKDKLWLGSDIKIMCSRINKDVTLILCVPQIGLYVNSLNEYQNNLSIIKETIYSIAEETISDFNLSININMRDKFDSESKDLYLTYTGSSIEMGDEGFVGRGNRFGGLITPNRLYSMEGIAGKNPVYHTGKMYSAMAYELSKKIYEKYGKASESLLIGVTGQSLKTPSKIVVKIEDCDISENDILQLFNQINPSEITEKILEGEYEFF